MRVVFTKHAQKRIHQRNISKTEVRLTVKSPERVRSTGSKRIVWRVFKKRKLTVVYIKHPTIILIVTAYYEN